jgi:hypothetical protein
MSGNHQQHAVAEYGASELRCDQPGATASSPVCFVETPRPLAGSHQSIQQPALCLTKLVLIAPKSGADLVLTWNPQFQVLASY